MFKEHKLNNSDKPPVKGSTVPWTTKKDFAPKPEEELRDFEYKKIDIKKIKLSSELGHGANGYVWLGEYKNELVALKAFGAPSHDFKTYETFKKEMAFFELSKDSPHIIHFKYWGSFDWKFESRHRQYFFLALEYAPFTLDFILRNKQSFSWAECSRIAFATAKGLQALQEKKIIHRDLAPKNILLTEDGEVKITDFSVSILYQTDNRELVGTPDYTAPEILRGEAWSPASDIFSFGLMLFYLITNESCETLYRGNKNDAELRKFISEAKAREGCPEDLHRLCLACCHENPEARPTIFEITARLEAINRPFAKLEDMLPQKLRELKALTTTTAPPIYQVEQLEHERLQDQSDKTKQPVAPEETHPPVVSNENGSVTTYQQAAGDTGETEPQPLDAPTTDNHEANQSYVQLDNTIPEPNVADPVEEKQLSPSLSALAHLEAKPNPFDEPEKYIQQNIANLYQTNFSSLFKSPANPKQDLQIVALNNNINNINQLIDDYAYYAIANPHLQPPKKPNKIAEKTPAAAPPPVWVPQDGGNNDALQNPYITEQSKPRLDHRKDDASKKSEQSPGIDVKPPTATISPLINNPSSSGMFSHRVSFYEEKSKLPAEPDREKKEKEKPGDYIQEYWVSSKDFLVETKTHPSDHYHFNFSQPRMDYFHTYALGMKKTQPVLSAKDLTRVLNALGIEVVELKEVKLKDKDKKSCAVTLDEKNAIRVVNVHRNAPYINRIAALIAANATPQVFFEARLNPQADRRYERIRWAQTLMNEILTMPLNLTIEEFLPNRLQYFHDTINCHILLAGDPSFRLMLEDLAVLCNMNPPSAEASTTSTQPLAISKSCGL